MYPLFSEGLTLFLQEAAQIAAEDPGLTRQIVEWSHQRNNPKWAVDPTLARNNLRKWLEVARQRSPHQGAAALLLADLFVEGTRICEAYWHIPNSTRGLERSMTNKETTLTISLNRQRRWIKAEK